MSTTRNTKIGIGRKRQLLNQLKQLCSLNEIRINRLLINLLHKYQEEPRMIVCAECGGTGYEALSIKQYQKYAEGLGVLPEVIIGNIKLIDMATINTRIIDITVGELLEILNKQQQNAVKTETPNQPAVEQKYVYGIAGIAELFNCSKTTANAIKQSGKIDKALSQCGRKIIIDASLALELAGKTK